MTEVVNKYHTKEPYIWCGRPSIYGNPFILGPDGNRDEVCDKYEIYFNERIENDPDFKKEVSKLKNKVIACCCKPKRCHLDTIARWLNKNE